MERDLRGTWKTKNPGIKKTNQLILGWIYQSHNIQGVLIEHDSEYATLKTLDGVKKVLKNSLKIVASCCLITYL